MVSDQTMVCGSSYQKTEVLRYFPVLGLLQMSCTSNRSLTHLSYSRFPALQSADSAVLLETEYAPGNLDSGLIFAVSHALNIRTTQRRLVVDIDGLLQEINKKTDWRMWR